MDTLIKMCPSTGWSLLGLTFHFEHLLCGAYYPRSLCLRFCIKCVITLVFSWYLCLCITNEACFGQSFIHMDHPSQRSYVFDLAHFTPGALLYPISNPLWDLCLLEGSLLCWVTVLPTTPEPLALKKATWRQPKC